MSTHFWFGGEDSPYLVKKSTRFDDASLSRAPQEDDPYQYGKTSEIASVTVETADGDIVSAGFSATTYTGDGTPQSITGLGFSPDLVWVKNRTGSPNNNVLFDTIRGPGERLYSDNSNSEGYEVSSLTSFDSDGFTLGGHSSTNENGIDWVSWCWDAGDTTVTNNEGFIPSQVRANQLSGFSIVSYTGNGDGGVNAVGHGLGVAPSLMIIKNRDSSSENWIVYSSELGPDNFLFLNSSSSSTYSSPPTYLNSTHPNEIAFSLGGSTATCGQGTQYIAYCWAESPTQSFGSYTGTAAEQTVDLGFAPAFVLIKSTTTNEQWYAYDTARQTSSTYPQLYPNLTSLEDTVSSRNVELTDSGFTILGADGAVNGSGLNYIYAAFGDTYSEPPVEQQTLQFTAPTSLDNDLKTELFAPGEIVSQDSAYLATTDTVTSIESTAGYVINNSLLFNGTDTYLNRTPTVSGNRKTFTLSWWTKPTSDEGNQRIFGIGGQGNLQFSMMWGGNGILSFYSETTGTTVGFDTYRRKDSSSWMHCVLTFDTTQSSQSERMKFYIDGELLTSDDYTSQTFPALNSEFYWNDSASIHYIGRYTAGIDYFLGAYMAEVQSVDGLALSAQEFGEYDADGRWVAKAYLPSVSTSAITGVTSNVGITEQVPEGVTGDYSGILGVTPSDTSGTFAVFPDGGGTAASKGTFYWANMTPGDTITWYGTSSASNNIRNVVGDVDETTITSPGTSLGSFTLTVNASSGSAKVDFNTDSNCYGITPGPGGTVLALTDDTNLDGFFVGDTVSSDAATAVVSAVDIYALYDQNETGILSPGTSQANTIGNQDYFNSDINDSNKVGNKGFYVYDTNSITISYSGLSAGTNIGIVAGPASNGVTSLDLNFTVSGDVTQSGSVTFYSGSTLSGSKNTLPKQLNNLTTTGSSGSFTLNPALTSDNSNLSQLYIQWIEGMGSTTNIIAIDESAPSITTGGGTWSNGDIAIKNIPYGTNGFNLDFSDTSSNSALGTDSSGNENDFTVNNLNHTSVLLPAADPVPLLPQDAWDGLSSTYAYAGDTTTWTFTTPIDVTSGRLDIGARPSWTWTANTNLGIVTLAQAAASWPGGGSYPGWYYYINAGLTTIFSITVNYSSAGNWTLQGMQIAGSPAVVGVQLIQITEVTTSVVSDSPTNGGQVSTGAGGEVSGNYATWNPMVVDSNGFNVLSEGNLVANHNSGGWAGNISSPNGTQIVGSFGMSSGKWYWEYQQFDGNEVSFGIADSPVGSQYYPGYEGSVGYTTTQVYNGIYPGTGVSNMPTISIGDIIGVALDMDTGKVYFSNNGVFINSGDPVGGTGECGSGMVGQTMFPAIGQLGSTGVYTVIANFGQRPFAYPMPEGYKTLRTSNL